MPTFKKALFFTLGAFCVALSVAGLFLPVLPTTPFLLLAAFFFARSSDRALRWLMNNRWFGPYLRNYREGRGMAARDKVITLVILWVTILLSAGLVVESLWVRVVLLVVAVGVTFHLLRIKTCRPAPAAQPVEPTAEID